MQVGARPDRAGGQILLGYPGIWQGGIVRHYDATAHIELPKRSFPQRAMADHGPRVGAFDLVGLSKSTEARFHGTPSSQ